MKTCVGCELCLPFEEFHFSTTRRGDGYNSRCKLCDSARRNADYKSDPEKRRIYLRCQRYGLDHAEYKTRLIEQDGKCAICRDVFLEAPHIDHCHMTLRVRGLLCSSCNTMLGFAKDNVANLQRGIEYLTLQDWPVVRNT